jgi:hypothetical protein
MTAMNWMGFDNIARFLNYRCGFRRRYRPGPAHEIGLYADGFSGKTFPAGKQRFVYSIASRHRADPPTEQEAVITLVDRCLALLPPDSAWPVNSTNWADFSKRCAVDLMAEGHCWRDKQDGKGEYILNYVDGYSPAWKEAMEARGRTFDVDRPCLESALWSEHPLAALALVDRSPEFARLKERLRRFSVPILRQRAADRAAGPPAESGPANTFTCWRRPGRSRGSTPTRS